MSMFCVVKCKTCREENLSVRLTPWPRPSRPQVALSPAGWLHPLRPPARPWTGWAAALASTVTSTGSLPLRCGTRSSPAHPSFHCLVQNTVSASTSAPVGVESAGVVGGHHILVSFPTARAPRLGLITKQHPRSCGTRAAEAHLRCVLQVAGERKRVHALLAVLLQAHGGQRGARRGCCIKTPMCLARHGLTK